MLDDRCHVSACQMPCEDMQDVMRGHVRVKGYNSDVMYTY